MMIVNNHIKEKLATILSLYNFSVSNEYDNFVEFSNDIYSITVSHNQMENSNSLSIGKKNSHLIEINKRILKSIFNLDINIENLPFIQFLENVEKVLNSIVKLLFSKDSTLIEEMEDLDYLEAKRYTRQLIHNQNLKIADKAWNEKKYSEFIRIFDELYVDLLPNSYIMKLDYAKKQLNN